MASQICSTPPPPSSVRTPGTPKHGYSDSWEPFSPRKSARISEKRASARTPSPNSIARKPSARKASSNIFFTPAASPQKKRLPAMDSVRRAPPSIAADGRASVARLLDIPSTSSAQPKSKSGSATRSSGMMPTPAKTPRKQPTPAETSAVHSVARNLFGTDADMIASPRKRQAKKYSGITLESFIAEDVEQPIAIFTDSRDRVPSVDRSSQNPFYGSNEEAQPEPTRKRSKRRQVTIPGVGAESVEEAVRRDDGIVYVFRGKRIFRKFSDCQDGYPSALADFDDEDMSLEAAAEEEAPRRLTRSAIKPRLLFPPRKKAPDVGEDDEEAVTDIEDNNMPILSGPRADELETPTEVSEKLSTPKAPRFAPASPPSTSRTTRTSSKLIAGDSSMKRAVKSGSPFDSWRVSKRTSGRTGLKREGDALESSFDAPKRQRI